MSFFNYFIFFPKIFVFKSFEPDFFPIVGWMNGWENYSHLLLLSSMWSSSFSFVILFFKKKETKFQIQFPIKMSFFSNFIFFQYLFSKILNLVFSNCRMDEWLRKYSPLLLLSLMWSTHVSFIILSFQKERKKISNSVSHKNVFFNYFIFFFQKYFFSKIFNLIFSNSRTDEWSRKLFPLAFAFFNVIYWCQFIILFSSTLMFSGMSFKHIMILTWWS